MKYAKAVAALLGGLSPAAIVGLLTVFHIHISPELISEVYTVAAPILATLFVASGPANKVEAEAAPVVEKAAAEVETLAHDALKTSS